MQSIVAATDNSFTSPKRQVSIRFHAQTSNNPCLPSESWYSVKRYYNRTIFIVFRGIGLFVAILSILFEIVAIASNCWYYGNFFNATRSEGGLFELIDHDKHLAPAIDSVSTWKKITMVLMIASAACGVFGFALNARGLCAGKIQQRLYYVHSAGEIYFVGGLCGLAVVSIYPTFVVQAMTVAVMVEMKLGSSYYLTIAGTILLLFCTFCMMLDELIQIFSRPRDCIVDCCCTCWKRCYLKCIAKRKEPSLSDSLPSGVVQAITSI